MDESALYNRAMGRNYDPRRLAIEESEGFGYSHDQSPVDDSYEASEKLDFVVSESAFEDMALLQDAALGRDLSPEDYARVVVVEAQQIVRAEQERLNDFHQDHPMYSLAIRDWAFEAIRQRGISSGEDLLEVQAEIINNMISEFVEDDEDSMMIDFARTWLDETKAAQTLRTVRIDFRKFDLAA